VALSAIIVLRVDTANRHSCFLADRLISLPDFGFPT
jgi:hypothetical protein